MAHVRWIKAIAFAILMAPLAALAQTVPGAPTITGVTAGNAQVTVAFNPPASNGGSPITGYQVKSNPGAIVASGTSSPIVVTGLTNGTSYTFTAVAINAIGSSAPSAASSPVTPAAPPGAPTIGTATAGNGQATVTFTAPASDGGSPITSYTAKSNPGNITATGSASPIVVTGLTNGTAYTFTVAATNAAGTGPLSAASNSVTPGGAPAFTSGAPPGGTFGAAYSHTFTASGSPSPVFTVSSGALPAGLTLATSGALTGTPTAVGNFTAVISAGNAVGTATQSISITIVPTVPGAPSIGTATGGNAQASISFAAPASNGGAPITGYTATSSPGGITATGTASPIVVNGLTNGAPYTFTVTATNSAGTGPASAASNSVTPGLPAVAPVIMTSAPPNGTFGVPYLHQYAATGTPAPTFALASGTLPQGLSLATNGALTGTPSAPGTSTGTVTASNSAGSASQSFSITIAATVPGAPTIGTATAGIAQASVAFMPPASTGGAAIVSYTVTSNPGAISATGSASPIVVSGLAIGTAYTFTVVATNAVGMGPPSASSNSVTPTPAIDPVGPAPVFPMTVTTNITATTASASAQIQPRTQDVGKTVSVFVFAHAPASLLRKAAKRIPGASVPFDREDDDYCVLAQLNAGGQLAAVSASTMQAYSTGVITSQGQAVSILNNASTSSVAGATFYVGYGQSAAGMLTDGVYQDAVSIPGASQCTASFTAAPAPNSPGALSGLWWNANESGWGIHFTQRRNILFAAWYTYDTSGNPKWYVASSCTMPTGSTGTSGTCNGTLYEVTGPTYFGTTFNPALANVRSVGSLQVNFQDANTASMSYTANGESRSVAITRQVFQSGTATPAVDYTDLWWNANESGWGMAISHQYGVMFLAWYVYDANGKPVWYVASNCVVSGSSCAGTLYRTTGPVFGPAFNPAQVQVFSAGTVSLGFTDANSGTLTYTVGGVTATKSIVRQVF